MAFQVFGFEECKNPALEPGWEKIALFASAASEPTHAARQLPDGRWTSKLGTLEDIMHPELEHVSGSAYGSPAVILRRRTASLEAASGEVNR